MRVRNRATWEMTAEELAKVWADHYGYEGRSGGWIYSPDGKPVAHGWTTLARILSYRGVIKEGTGIIWKVYK